MSEEVQLPDSWLLTTLETVTEPSRLSVRPAESPSFPFIGMEHVEAETMRLLGTVPASEMRSNALKFEPGDVLYGRLRPYLNKVYRPDFEGLCSAEFIVFPQSPHLAPGYLQYFLNSWRFKTFASHLNAGDRPRVDWDQLKSFDFPLPPLAEQRRIVAAIEEQFTRLDAGVTALRRTRAALKRYRAAVLKAAVEGRLTAAWRATHADAEPASALLGRILAERRGRWEAEQRAKGKDPAKARYDEPAAPDTAGLPEVPEGWVWATVEQLASYESRSLQSGPFGSALHHSEFQSTGVLAIGIDNVLEGRFSMGREHRIAQEKYKELERFTARPLDVLVTVMATVGRCCVVPADLETAIITKHVYRISVDKRIGYPYFVMYALQGGAEVRKQLFGQIQGQTRPGINGEILRRIALPVPSISEQEQIVAEVERRLSVVSELEATVEANLKRAERLRQAILERAFSGRLIPQDPADEPASALLARIRRARGGEGGGGRREEVAAQVGLWE